MCGELDFAGIPVNSVQTTSVGYTLDSRSGAMMTSLMTRGVIADGTRCILWQVFSPAQVRAWMKAWLTLARVPVVHGKQFAGASTLSFWTRCLSFAAPQTCLSSADGSLQQSSKLLVGGFMLRAVFVRMAA